jgi:hypothetical protein
VRNYTYLVSVSAATIVTFVGVVTSACVGTPEIRFVFGSNE